MDQFGDPFDPSDAQVITRFLLPHLREEAVPEGMRNESIFNRSPIEYFQGIPFPVDRPAFFITERKYHGRNFSRSANRATWVRRTSKRLPIDDGNGRVVGYKQKFSLDPDIGAAGWEMTEYTYLGERPTAICKIVCARIPNLNEDLYPG